MAVARQAALVSESAELVENSLRKASTILLLSELPEAYMRRLLDGMSRMEVPPQESIFEQGAKGDALYVIERGSVEVRKRLRTEEKDELHIETVGPGSHVGEMALLYDEPRACSAVVVGKESALLWRLPRDHFLHLVEEFGKEGGTQNDVEESGECEIDLDKVQSIFVVSDNTGETALNSVTLALKQFDFCYGASGYVISKYSSVREPSEVLEICRRARSEQALVVYTLMQPQARETMKTEAERNLEDGEEGLMAVDLWEPMLVQLEHLLGPRRQPVLNPEARRPPLADAALKMIDAIQFTKELDDGNHPERWVDADLVLLGLSRGGKTPLAFYLAQRGYKVANYPIVPDEDPPEELFSPEVQDKVVGLIISPQRLQSVRNERMREYGRKGSQYSSVKNCSKEVGYVKAFYALRGPRWPVVDVTNGGVEEAATKVMRILKKREVPDPAGAGSLSPSVA